MGLQHSYRILAPIYNTMVSRATRAMRKSSIDKLGILPQQQVLLAGIGTGLDLPLLPHHAYYHGIDITPAMLKRIPLSEVNKLLLSCGDVMKLPYADNSFDLVIMHLIVAVVAKPQTALHEACRVTKPGGRIIVLDKFIRAGQLAIIRRLISPLLGLFITRTNVVFENLVENCTELEIISDQAIPLSSWFRRIELKKILATRNMT